MIIAVIFVVDDIMLLFLTAILQTTQNTQI